VSIDLRFDRAERRVAAFVCERGAHWVNVEGHREGRRGGRGEGGRTNDTALGKSAAESQREKNFTLHETDIAVYLCEREFSWTHGNG
jgi:hypothetical protein